MVAHTPTAFLSLLLLIAAPHPDHASRIANLIDRSKLSNLGQRAANPRVQKAVYWLAMARAEGQQPVAVLDRACAQAGYEGLAATLTRDSLLRNLDIGEAGMPQPNWPGRDAPWQSRHHHDRSLQATNSPSITSSPEPSCANWTTSSPTWS